MSVHIRNFFRARQTSLFVYQQRFGRSFERRVATLGYKSLYFINSQG